MLFGRKFNNYLGLLVVQTYSIYKGNVIIIIALVFGFLAGMVINLLGKDSRTVGLGMIRERSHSFQI